jgi:hypothetical protein
MNLTSPLHTHWRPLNEAECPALPPYLSSLWELTHGPDRDLPRYADSVFSEDYRLLSASPEPFPSSWLSSNNGSTIDHDPIYFLRKKRSTPPTVLVIGDSVDRNGLVHFCQLFKRNVTISHYHDIHRHPPDPPVGDLTKGHGPKFEGWDQRGLPHLCEIPFYSEKGRGHSGVAMRIVNGFHYGMDALDEFDTPDHADWHKPGRVEVRIEELVVPMLEQMGGTDSVDVVQLHSGMWDLVSLVFPSSPAELILPLPLAGSLWPARRQDQVESHRPAHTRATRLVARADAPYYLPRSTDVPEGEGRLPQAAPNRRFDCWHAVHHQL